MALIICDSDILAYQPATPTRIRQYLFEEHSFSLEEIEAIMMEYKDLVTFMCEHSFLTYKAGETLRCLGSAPPAAEQ